MKDLRPIRGKYYISDLISQGEHETQDFKFRIDDALKIARSISAFANHSGGSLLIGVKDNGVIAGVRSEEDVYVVEQAAQMYCRPAVNVRFTAFRADDEGRVVIRASIPAADRRPVKAREPDGRWRAYYRVADENILASPLMVRAWMLTGSEGGKMFDSDGPARLLLNILERDGKSSVDVLMREAHVSRPVAEECVVALASMHLLDFHWDGHAFRLIATND